ncbi:hypothetical protein [Polyangium sp. 6x1]|uniref:hypothetical protein n=1 Tax=Polyangium sp. 6x1 TaxID=3042689 RepID=UPI0024823DA6|nr:hypothetical protein [Polyangium sp. 6x1]MDI1443665.1 hypothetical protein [Polyangium sp. 6x1]
MSQERPEVGRSYRRAPVVCVDGVVTRGYPWALSLTKSGVDGRGALQHDAPRIFRIGSAHRLTFEPPDLVMLSLNGPLEADDVMACFDAFEEVSGGRQVLLLSDVSRTSGPTMRARKVATKDPRIKLMGPQAMIGASYHVRIVMTMLETAARLVQGKSSPTAFFDDEASARAWLLTQRALLRSV